MSGIRSDASLKGKIRQLAKEHELKSQEVLQMYLFEHLLRHWIHWDKLSQCVSARQDGLAVKAN